VLIIIVALAVWIYLKYADSGVEAKS